MSVKMQPSYKFSLRFCIVIMSFDIVLIALHIITLSFIIQRYCNAIAIVFDKIFILCTDVIANEQSSESWLYLFRNRLLQINHRAMRNFIGSKY